MSQLTRVARAADAFRQKYKMGAQTEDSALLALFAHALLDGNNQVVIDPRDLAATLTNLVGTDARTLAKRGVVVTKKTTVTLAMLKAQGATNFADGFGNLNLGDSNNTGFVYFTWKVRTSTPLAGPGLSAAVLKQHTSNEGLEMMNDYNLRATVDDTNFASMPTHSAAVDVAPANYPLEIVGDDDVNFGVYLTGCNANALTAGQFDIWQTYTIRQ